MVALDEVVLMILMPTDPAVCGPEEVVVSTCHASGSGLPTRQAFARSAVGEVPWVCTRIVNESPGDTGRPVLMSGEMVVPASFWPRISSMPLGAANTPTRSYAPDVCFRSNR